MALALSMAFVTSMCAAQAPQISRVDVTEFGEYTLEGKARDQLSAHGIPQRTVGNVKQLREARLIRLHKKLHFGFFYTIMGSPNGADVKIRMVMVYPAPGLIKPGERARILRDEAVKMRTIGDNYYRGFTIDDDWMMVPGDWTFELWYGEQKIASETFTLVK
jgi:hypothetical protein